MPNIRLKAALASDVPQILHFIRQLAEYEKLADKVIATEDRLQETLFGPKPGAEVVIAYWGEEAAGFALFFQTYSTFLAQPGIYLEDLFVEQKFRGEGIGKALLVHLAQLVEQRGGGRLEWSVLNWNEPSIQFYKRLGAEPLDAWTMYRVTGEKLKELAQTL